MRIGIDLGGTKIEGIVLDENGNEQARRRIAAPQGHYQQTVETIAGLVTALEHEADAAGASIGVGIPGAVSPASGKIKNANSTWIIGHPLDKDLEARLGRPVRIANDANCFAVSEAIDGAAAGAATVFGVILGTGVGGGVVIDGKVRTGLNAIAGEWGHNPLPWPNDFEHPGADCYCGKKGCIETFLSGPGMARDHAAQGGGTLTAEEITSAAAKDDTGGQDTLARYQDRLARALATMINILDPDVIVLGGGLSNIGGLYETVPRLWQDWVFSDRADTPLHKNKHGDSSGVRGAAWLWDH